MPILVNKCNLCGSSSFTFLYQTKDKLLGIDGIFYLYECNDCHLRFLNPQPTHEELREYYPKNYTAFKSGPLSWRDKLDLFIYKLKLGRISRLLYYPLKVLIRCNVNIYPGGKFLDIGCGSGNLLKMAKSLGMECYGVDSYSGIRSVNVLDGISIYNRSIEDAEFPENFFDTIVLNHVLEHTVNPLNVFLKLKKFIKPGGTIIVQVPNGGSLISTIFKKHYQGIDSPRHLYVFNIRNIKKYCDLLRLKVEKIEFRLPITASVLIDSMVYFFNEKFKLFGGSSRERINYSKLVRLCVYPICLILCLLGRGDGVEFHIKK